MESGKQWESKFKALKEINLLTKNSISGKATFQK